jgi:hypothetical protein
MKLHLNPCSRSSQFYNPLQLDSIRHTIGFPIFMIDQYPVAALRTLIFTGRYIEFHQESTIQPVTPYSEE